MASLSDLYYKIQQASAKDLEETVEPGDAKSLMLARIKALNPFLDEADRGMIEKLPGGQKGALALEESMKYTPYGLAGRPDVGAAVAQFLPQAGAEVLNVGGMITRPIAGVLGKLDKLKALKAVQRSSKGSMTPEEGAQHYEKIEQQFKDLVGDFRNRKLEKGPIDLIPTSSTGGALDKMDEVSRMRAINEFIEKSNLPALQKAKAARHQAAVQQDWENVINKLPEAETSPLMREGKPVYDYMTPKPKRIDELEDTVPGGPKRR